MQIGKLVLFSVYVPHMFIGSLYNRSWNRRRSVAGSSLAGNPIWLVTDADAALELVCLYRQLFGPPFTCSINIHHISGCWSAPWRDCTWFHLSIRRLLWCFGEVLVQLQPDTGRKFVVHLKMKSHKTVDRVLKWCQRNFFIEWSK